MPFRRLLFVYFCLLVLNSASISQVIYSENPEGNLVTADIKLTFSVKPRIALAIHDGNKFTSNPVFDPMRLLSPSVLVLADSDQYPFVISGEAYGTGSFGIDFGKNKDIQLVHELGSKSGKITCNLRIVHDLGVIDVKSSKPKIIMIDTTTLQKSQLKGILAFSITATIDPNSISNQDRMGDYYGSYTISIFTV